MYAELGPGAPGPRDIDDHDLRPPGLGADVDGCERVDASSMVDSPSRGITRKTRKPSVYAGFNDADEDGGPEDATC